MVHFSNVKEIKCVIATSQRSYKAPFKVILSPGPLTSAEIAAIIVGGSIAVIFFGFSVGVTIYCNIRFSSPGGLFSERKPVDDEADQEDAGPSSISNLLVYPTGKKEKFKNGNIIEEYEEVQVFKLQDNIS